MSEVALYCRVLGVGEVACADPSRLHGQDLPKLCHSVASQFFL